MSDATGQFLVLIVCTGNICRSPAAERLLRVHSWPGVLVESAGTSAHEGLSIDPPMVPLLQSAGAETTTFRSRRLSTAHVNGANLILTMTKDQRSDTVQLLPKAVQKTFTLLEYARLLNAVDGNHLPKGTISHRLRLSIAMTAARRQHVRSAYETDNVQDPYGTATDVYVRIFRQLETSIQTITKVIDDAGKSF